MELASELERYREKLLDLSNRNPLLSYRKNTRTIQIVDELPNQIFARLVDGKRQFRFVSASDDEPKQAKVSRKNQTQSVPEEQPTSTGEIAKPLLAQPNVDSPPQPLIPASHSRVVLTKRPDGETESQFIEPSDEVPLLM